MREGETAKLGNDADNQKGDHWVGIDISDADGKFLDVHARGPSRRRRTAGGIGSTPMATVTIATLEKKSPAALPVPPSNTSLRRWPSITGWRRRSIVDQPLPSSRIERERRVPIASLMPPPSAQSSRGSSAAGRAVAFRTADAHGLYSQLGFLSSRRDGDAAAATV